MERKSNGSKGIVRKPCFVGRSSVPRHRTDREGRVHIFTGCTGHRESQSLGFVHTKNCSRSGKRRCSSEAKWPTSESTEGSGHLPDIQASLRRYLQRTRAG